MPASGFLFSSGPCCITENCVFECVTDARALARVAGSRSGMIWHSIFIIEISPSPGQVAVGLL